LNEYEIRALRDSRIEDSYMKFHNRAAALSFLRSCMDSRRNIPVLRDCLADALHSPLLNRFTWHDLAEQLANQLVIGNIRIVTSAEREAPGGGHGKKPEKKKETPPVQPAVPPTPIVPEKPVEPAKWIEFQVVDEETGEGVAGVALRVKLADRVAQNFATKDDGQIRIDNIMSGSDCNIEDITAAEYLEVVEIK